MGFLRRLTLPFVCTVALAGLRCGDIYYGPTIPTHDVYTSSAITLPRL